MKKIYVGKPKRKKAIIIMSVFIALDIFFLICYVNPQESMIKNAYIGMNNAVPIIIIGLFLMTFLVVGPIYYSTSLWWSIDEKKLHYCCFPHYLSRLKAFYLPHYSQNYFISLSTKDIQSITLSWQYVSMFVFGQYAHPIYFRIDMSYGSELYLEALVTKKSKELLVAIDFMKSLGIEINDPYHLLKAIQNPHMSVAQYIDDLEKRGRYHD